jgi:FlaA1/EpsC-like NDP-sugar epimerase
VDIAIEIVGPRPGEKVHEDLFNADERARPTGADKIVAAERPALDADWVEQAFARVEDIVYAGDAATLAATVSELAAERVLAGEQRARAG